MNNNTLYASAELLGRVLIALIFIGAGVSKIGGYAGTQAYMESMGVPGMLLPLVILTELGGGILIVLGLWTRVTAFLVGGFSALSGILFHHNFANQIDQIMFLKDFAIAGGFLFLVVHGAGRFSLDARRAKT